MCDVLAILSQRCWSCHGTTLHDKATHSMVTLEQLKGASGVDPAKSYLERGVIRMEAAKNPMPPTLEPTVKPEEVALIKAWIAAGYPEASCGDVAKDPYVAPVKCSGELLPAVQEHDEEMSPGHVCNTCHAQVNAEEGGDAPLFLVSGTVFKTAHEPNDCGSSVGKGAEITITDSKGKVVVLEANETGNFIYEENDLVFPYTAKVTFEGRERAMALPQTNGSCNECHTEAGTEEAPGRVLLP
jgi:hypothetical protein